MRQFKAWLQERYKGKKNFDDLSTDEKQEETGTSNSQSVADDENTPPKEIQENGATTPNPDKVSVTPSNLDNPPQSSELFVSLKDVEDLIAVSVANTETRVKNELKLMIRTYD